MKILGIPDFYCANCFTQLQPASNNSKDLYDLIIHHEVRPDCPSSGKTFRCTATEIAAKILDLKEIT